MCSPDEQHKILSACHVDPTSGHMDVKRTLNRIIERFKWPGMVKDVLVSPGFHETSSGEVPGAW